MGVRGWILVIAFTGMFFTAYLSVLAAAGLGDLDGESDAVLPTAVSASGVDQSAPPGGLVVTAKDIKFEPTSLQAAAGEQTITFENKDQTIHNLHVFKGDDNTGESLGATKLENGPLTASLNLQLEPGKYYYQCDVHPGQMNGILTVGP